MIEIAKTAKAVEKDGKYWGLIYADGQSQSWGWVNGIQNAKLSIKEDALFLDIWEKQQPSGWIHPHSGEEDLKNGKMITLKIKTIYEVVE